MIYAFHESAGEASLLLEGDSFKHLIKVRRASVGDTLTLRHPDKSENFIYIITQSDKRSATLSFQSSNTTQVQASHALHIGWCQIDPKSVEKVLPSLVELGVSAISFIRCERSQNNFTMDEKRLERIIVAAMQQCGNTQKPQLFFNVDFDTFCQNSPNMVVLDFCDTVLERDEAKSLTHILLGAEGGFSDEEKAVLCNYTVRRLNTPLVLRSETAAISVASLILL